MIRARYCLLFFAWGVARADVKAVTCSFHPLTIAPLGAEPATTYKGLGQRVEVLFKNDKLEGPVENFPESPLTIRDVIRGTQCEIEGGVWSRSRVFLSDDERRLLVSEFSGSNEDIKIYDTRSCRQKSVTEVSTSVWRIDASHLEVGRQCSGDTINSCTQRVTYAFTRDCKPQRQVAKRSTGKK